MSLIVIRMRGFTLLESMIVLAVLAIMATIAIPSYDAHVKRSRILDAVNRLAEARARMEDYFLDQRAYVDGAGRCAVQPAGRPTDSFALGCEATATTFVYTARGLATKGMAAFVYTIDHSGAKSTLSVPGGWSRSPACWTIRKDGFCV